MMAAPVTRPLRTVIIDDTEDLRDLLRIALTRGGFEVVAEAGDGSTGIDVVRLHRPDVVMLDLAMPVMDGIEALPSIRRLVPSAKIVVLSGFGAQQMSARAIAAGADGYVQKGANLSTIVDYVRETVAGASTATSRATRARALSVVPADGSTHDAPSADKVGRGLSVVPPGDGGERALPAAPTAAASAPPAPPATAPTPSVPRAPAPVAGPGGGQGSGGPGGPGEQSSNVSAWEALRAAPYGVLELADEPLFRIVHANPFAARLLGTDKAGTPLALVAAELASLVAFHRLDNDASFETDLSGGRVRASLRRTGWSVLVFLDSATEDVGALRRAIATAAHEVRGPVAVLCGIAETLAWDGADMDHEQTQRLLTSVSRQARILDRITADLLTAAQIQRGTLRLDVQSVDPRQIVQGVVDDRPDVEVVLEEDRTVRADPLRLEQMLTNLLSNAAKYGAAPFQVHVRPAGEQGEMVAIDVIDHGPGVPADFAPQLFNEFARAHGAVATGTGLGLYVVRSLALAQGGDVVHAPNPEGGAIFTITLHAG
ncbi:MAG: hypothetical protein CMH83_11250 [Nocardioides sp.]|nr:hypothetical protein [Nocardioides sp.]